MCFDLLSLGFFGLFSELITKIVSGFIYYLLVILYIHHGFMASSLRYFYLEEHVLVIWHAYIVYAKAS